VFPSCAERLSRTKGADLLDCSGGLSAFALDIRLRKATILIIRKNCGAQTAIMSLSPAGFQIMADSFVGSCIRPRVLRPVEDRGQRAHTTRGKSERIGVC